MEKKQIHFFGCSHTAGHELPDSYVFPWLNECKSPEDYYKKFGELTLEEFNLDTYKMECKKLAYPALLSNIDQSYECVNHAEFGSSIKCEMYKAINLIEQNKTKIDLLVFQIPYFTREFILTNENKFENKKYNSFTRYAEGKLVSHSTEHWGFHGHIELLLFEGYLESKKIPSIFLQLGDANDAWIDIFGLARTVDIVQMLDYIEYNRSIGRHYDYATHVNIANHIKTLIDAKLFP
jgi:hypothetical protein